jgi:long-subunit acyl-CoA synthetase (AMP-forming)
MFYRGKLEKYDDVRKYLSSQSILGGALEGVVIKNYALYGQDKKILMAKIVRDEFKEVHKTEWKKSNPTQSDVLQMLIGRYKTDARFEKAYQHLNEKGEILRECKDIPKLMKEVQEDIKKECEDEIKQILFSHFWESIKRASIGGVPEWYKRKLTDYK